MNVHVTIRIDREAIAEMAEVFREILGVAPGGQSGTQPIPAAQSQAVPPSIPVSQPAVQPQAVQPSIPVAQPAAQPVPVEQSAVPPYSAQIAQKAQLPVQAMTAGAVPAQGVPTTAVAQEYTQDQMAVALTGLIDTGRRELVTQILGAFGVQALTQIPKERYPELALKLREAGANI